VIKRRAEASSIGLLAIIISGCLYVVSELSIERISIIAALLYLISQHELNRVSEKTTIGYLKNILIVVIIGFSGGWFVTNILVIDILPDTTDSAKKLLQATFGFLSYEALLLLGGNAKSIARRIMDTIIERGRKE